MKLSRVRFLPARRRPSTITLAAMKPSSVPKPGSPLASASSARYSFTTGTDESQGKGTTCEICTPRPSRSSSLASALLPTKETFQKVGFEPAFFISLMKAAQDL